jgi:hypothetical protein
MPTSPTHRSADSTFIEDDDTPISLLTPSVQRDCRVCAAHARRAVRFTPSTAFDNGSTELGHAQVRPTSNLGFSFDEQGG